MGKPKFSFAQKEQRIVELVGNSDHTLVALWAMENAGQVLPYFEEKYPEDLRPRLALAALQVWIETGVFKMAIIRQAALDAHAAAREVGEDNAARSAARAAGQAVATAHVPSHAIAAATYALQAIHRASEADVAGAAAAKERERQYQRLLILADM